jgi:hypothetical protein
MKRLQGMERLQGIIPSKVVLGWSSKGGGAENNLGIVG